MYLRRNIGLGLLGLLIVGAIAWGFRPQPQPVDLAAVSRGPLQVSVEEEGKTRVVDRYIISAPVSGYAQRIDFKVGDSVQQGEILLQLEPLRPAALDARSRAEAQARVAAAESALRAAEEKAHAATADAQHAQSEYTRLLGLRKAQSVSESDLDRARAQANSALALQHSAEFAVDVSRHELAAARTALRYAGGGGKAGDKVAVTTPVAGSVLKLYRESEGVVSAGQPLLEVGDPRRLEVAVDVLSSDAVQIQPGMQVLLEGWGGPRLEARVRRVEPTGFTKISSLGVEEQRVTVVADITSPPEQWRNLGDGYRVEASFVLWQGKDVLQIPASALFRTGKTWSVFVAADGHARLRTVEIGERNGLAAQVRKGLEAGEEVVTHPDDKLADGTRIEPR